MKSLFALIVASVALSFPVASKAQNPPDMFKDVDMGHWAYQAMETLRGKGILVGYPDGYFRGKRTLTRYEFAVALDRALKSIMPGGGAPGARGEKGDQGEKGETGSQGPAGMQPDDVANFKRLVDEFGTELKRKGNDLNAVNRRLDGLTKDVGEIRGILNNRPKIYGGAFSAFLANNANTSFANWDGVKFTPSDRNFTFNEFQFGVMANIPGGAKLDAAMIFGNYISTTGGSIAHPYSFQSSAPGDVILQKLEINTPFSPIGKGGTLTLGRFPYYGSNYTFWRPDVDRGFYNPFWDNGKYYMDGANFNTKVGSLNLGILATQSESVTGTSGMPFNLPYAGVSPSSPIFVNGDKPIGEANLGSANVEQTFGFTGSFPIRLAGGGHNRFSAYDTGSRSNYGSSYNNQFHEVFILGDDGILRINPKLRFGWDIGKTITHNGPHYVGTHQDVGGEAGFDVDCGKLGAHAGYKYIDPLFYAPGYWDWIGNWLNPVNIQGPKVNFNYDLSQSLGLHIGGEHYTPVHNRAALGGLGNNDEISRILAGFSVRMSKNFKTTVDWEGVYWTLDGAHSGISGIEGKVHPTESYVHIKTGYSLTNSTKLGLGLETGAFDGHGAFTGGYGGGYGGKYNYNAFTTQVNVKF